MYSRVKMADVLQVDLDPVPVDPTVTYPMVGIYSFGRGLFDREPVQGSNTSYRRFYRLADDHVVMSQLFGWEGALALSSSSFSGKYVSPQFPTFRCRAEKINREFLGWFLKTQSLWEYLGTCASGLGDRRRTLTPEALLNASIPLPPIEEQERVVSIINRAAARAKEITDTRIKEDEGCEQLLITMAHRKDLATENKLGLGWRQMQLGDVIRYAQEAHTVDPIQMYPNCGIYSFGRGLFRKPPIGGLATSASTLYRIKNQQFIYSRLFAFEGAYGIVTPEFDGCFVSGEYPTFDCDPKHIRAEFLWAYFKSPDIWSSLAAGSKGIGHRRQRVLPDKILAHELWVPPIEYQNKIAKVLKSLQDAKPIQTDLHRQLDALMPAILDKAFKGEL
jgi:type I restriction enzyme S subunit